MSKALPVRILFDSEYVRNTAAFRKRTTDQMARSFRSYHKYVYIRRRNDLFEMDIESMSKSKCTAVLQIRTDFRFIYISLFFIRNQDHRDIRFSNSFCNAFYCKSCIAGFFYGFAAFIQTDDNIDTAVSQIQCMGVTLTAISNNSHFLAFHYIPVYILIIKYFCHLNISPFKYRELPVHL
jgi:hypothetical protein